MSKFLVKIIMMEGEMLKHSTYLSCYVEMIALFQHETYFMMNQ